MRNCKTITLCGQLAALLVSCAGLPATAQAAGFTMDPASVATDYAGAITLHITGVATGQAVVVETFLDTNGNGAVDGDEQLVQSFQVTDGQALTIGGKRNLNVPGDEDGLSDGNIQTRLNFQALAEVPKGIANFVYRVSPATVGFAPIVFPFSVTQPVYAQKVVGQVTSGGVPVPFAYVFLVTPTSDGPVVGAMADADGNFALNAAAGPYMVGALKSGFLLNFDAAPQVTIPAGATVPQNVSLAAATRTIAGRVTDKDSGVGLAGVLMTAETGEPGWLGLGFSDATGNFTIPVSDATVQWVLYPSEKSAALLGYLLATDGYRVDTAGGSVSDVAIQLLQASALIWGTLTVDQGPPLAGVSICADNSGPYESCVLSDSGGNYVAGVVAGTWNVGADQDDLAALGYMGQGAQVTVGSGQALRQDLVARQPTAHLVGRVVDDSFPPQSVGNICIFAYPDQGAGVEGWSDGDGNFNLGVVAGTWHLSLCSDDAQQRGLVSPGLTYTVSDGVDQTGILYVAKRKTASITGHVQDNTNAPLTGVGVNAFTNVSGTPYGSWQETDANGNFSLGVIDGIWQVSLSCGDLGPRGYVCPGTKAVTVSGANQVVNFTVPLLAPCVGDCGTDGSVTIDDILTMVNIALGNPPNVPCQSGDVDSNGQITVDEIVTAVHHALNGC